MTIAVYQRPRAETRTSNKSCKWIAEAIVGGKTYAATSRMAPANEIAGQLVADGVPDDEMRIYTAGLKGCMIWRSFHKAAERTIEENASTPVASRRYRLPATDKQGVNAPATTPVGPSNPHLKSRRWRPDA